MFCIKNKFKKMGLKFSNKNNKVLKFFYFINENFNNTII